MFEQYKETIDSGRFKSPDTTDESWLSVVNFRGMLANDFRISEEVIRAMLKFGLSHCFFSSISEGFFSSFEKFEGKWAESDIY